MEIPTADRRAYHETFMLGVSEVGSYQQRLHTKKNMQEM